MQKQNKNKRSKKDFDYTKDDSKPLKRKGSYKRNTKHKKMIEGGDSY